MIHLIFKLVYTTQQPLSTSWYKTDTNTIVNESLSLTKHTYQEKNEARKSFVHKGKRDESCLPQFFLLPKMPCSRTAVGVSGNDLSLVELHLTCRLEQMNSHIKQFEGETCESVHHVCFNKLILSQAPIVAPLFLDIEVP